MVPAKKMVQKSRLRSDYYQKVDRSQEKIDCGRFFYLKNKYNKLLPSIYRTQLLLPFGIFNSAQAES